MPSLGGLILAVACVQACRQDPSPSSIPVCRDRDTLSIDEFFADRGRAVSDRRDSWFGREESLLIARHESRKTESIADRSRLIDLFQAYQAAHRYQEVFGLCADVVRADESPSSRGNQDRLRHLDECAKAAYYSGHDSGAIAYLDAFDSSYLELGSQGDASEVGGRIERVGMRADIYCLWRKDRMVMDLLLPHAWSWGWTRALAISIRRSHSPSQIIAEFDRAIESLRIDPYGDAPSDIRTFADSAFLNMDKPKNLGWIRLFGLHILVVPRKENSEEEPDRSAYVQAIKDGSPYWYLYCLPNTRDSLELVKERERAKE